MKVGLLNVRISVVEVGWRRVWRRWPPRVCPLALRCNREDRSVGWVEECVSVFVCVCVCVCVCVWCTKQHKYFLLSCER